MASPLPVEPEQPEVRSGRPRIAAGTKAHEVAFYDRDDQLVSTVVAYLMEGLDAGQPAVVIATGLHRRAFAEGIRAAGFDPVRLSEDGDLLLLDARRTLNAFLEGPTPVWELFQATIGNVLQRLRQRRPGAVVRGYGEMVDVLCREGNASGALALEEFWTRMTREHSFSLLCAYSDGSVLRSANGAAFRHICRAHELAHDLSA